MVVRKSVKATVERMTLFEQRELQCASETYRKLKDEDADIAEMLSFITEKRYIQDCGALALIYEEFLKFASEFGEEERSCDQMIVTKYRRYSERLESRTEYPEQRIRFSDYLEREAFCFIFMRDFNDELKLNEDFNSRMMMEDHGEVIRYIKPWKKWLIWNGAVWALDQQNRIYALARESLHLLRPKALLLPLKDEVYQLMDHAGRCGTVHKIEAMVKSVAWYTSVNILPDKLDGNNWLFNCSNGTLDCSCGRLREHRREDLITMITPVEYDPDARCPQWKNFLKTVFRGNGQLIRFVQKAVGTCLTGDVTVQSMFILYGTGANGKSTFMNLVMEVLGEYACTTPTETFMQRNGDPAHNDIARLKGKRFVSAMESELGGRLAESIVKRLTGDEKVSARFLYGEYFEYQPTFKIFMATNHKPKIGGMDEAIWRRLKLIPFDVTIPPEKQDRCLKDKLLKELPGILNWILEGCLLWMNEGLGHVTAIDDAMREYRGQMSSIEAFLESECVRDVNGRVKIAELYDRFVIWCEENNERVISKRALGMRMDEMNVEKWRDVDTWYRLGWRLKR